MTDLRARQLLYDTVRLMEVTHAYRIMGGHDCIGENLTCAGCALLNRIRDHLAVDQCPVCDGTGGDHQLGRQQPTVTGEP